MADPLHHLLVDLRTLVEGKSAGEDLRSFVAALDKLRGAATVAADTPPCALPVCRFWDMALRGAAEEGAPQGLVTALGSVARRLAWSWNPNYRLEPPTPDFLDNYGYAVIAGPRSGPPALLRDDGCALGVLLLGPETHYPCHWHPAAEIYVPLTSAEWWRAGDSWRRRPPGVVVHHASNVAHATKAARSPLLAFYLWTGQLDTHARLVTDD